MSHHDAHRLHRALRDSGITFAQVASLDGDKVRVVLDDSDARLLIGNLILLSPLTTESPPATRLTARQLSEVADKLRRVVSDNQDVLGVLTEAEQEKLNEHLHGLAFDLVGEE